MTGQHDSITPRVALFVDETMRTPEGYVPSLVTEGEAGHSPLAGGGPLARPWYFGKTIEEAKRQVNEYNRELGLTEDQALEVLLSSMRASNLFGR